MAKGTRTDAEAGYARAQKRVQEAHERAESAFAVHFG